MEMWKTAARAVGKASYCPIEKDKPFPQDSKRLSHSLAYKVSLHTFPQRLPLRLPILPRTEIKGALIQGILSHPLSKSPFTGTDKDRIDISMFDYFVFNI